MNQFFTQRPGATGTKHVFAGTTRIVSKLMKQDTPGANPQGNTPFEKDLYFFHPDHLGSSSFVTDTNGKLYEHLEYFPFGEAWVEESSNTQRAPYLFTAKELDEETGLYYFGARYYDPRTSVWQSGDPVLGQYLDGAPSGGVHRSGNLALYSYAYQNPLRYLDPTGLFNDETGEIEKGDTLNSIKNQLNAKFATSLSVSEIANKNRISDPNKIRAGDRIALPQFATQDAAAKAALNKANPKSISDNVEYGGLVHTVSPNSDVYQLGGYNYTGPVKGTDQGFNPSSAPAPAGTSVVGDYHTHGDYSIRDPNTGRAVRTGDPARDHFNSDNFSAPDIRGITNDARGVSGYKGYLGTPSGQFKVYDPATGTTRVLR